MKENEVEGVYEPEPKRTPCEASHPEFSPSRAYRWGTCCPISLEEVRSTNEATWL